VHVDLYASLVTGEAENEWCLFVWLL